MAEITNLNEPWAGHTGSEIEAFIKMQFGTKANTVRWYQPEDENFYYLLIFATSEDAVAWDTDKTVQPISTQKLPIPIVSTDAYACVLSTTLPTATQYVVKDGGSFKIPLRLYAIHSSAISGTEYLTGSGTVTFYQRSGGGDWNEVMSKPILASEEDGGYTEFDIKGLLATGRLNSIRIIATFPYTSEGEEKTASSSPIILSVNSVTLSLSMNTAWQDPIVNPSSSLQIVYNVNGSVEKTLHLRVKGSGSQTYTDEKELSVADTTAQFVINDTSSYGVTTHGVKECEAWLEAGDENSGIIESDHLVTQIMIVKSSESPSVYLRPKLLLQYALTKIESNDYLVSENFVQTRILSYAVYSPIVNDYGNIVNLGDSIPFNFILNNSTQSIIGGNRTVYSSLFVKPSPGIVYELDMTVEVESNNSIVTAFLHASREENGAIIDFLSETVNSGYVSVRVDNTGGFQPTANSTFLVNPKTRSNEEEYPNTIINIKNDNVVVPSTWNNFKFGNEDGYIKDEDGNPCLRVPAGRQLIIQYNPFDLFLSLPNASLNIEFDMCVRNVTNENDPILKIAEEIVSASGSTWRGLRMLPMTGYMTTESWQSESESDFRWQEDERTHFAINIVRNVYPNAHNDALVTGDKEQASQGSLPLVRVFINGVIQREIVYNPSVTEFCTSPMSNGGIIIGQDGADIDIYGIRIWENNALNPQQVLQDYISTIPSSETKRKLKSDNNIINPNTGLVDLELVVGIDGIHKNALVWHGKEEYFFDKNSGKGWLEAWRYDDEGNYIPELSGTICKETAINGTGGIPSKGQGTTANTYYYHNQQWDISKATGMITISPDIFHESIEKEWIPDYEWGGSEPNGAWKIRKGYLGKNYPHPDESFQYYHGNANSITVPDGWIDGNGKYRGKGYQVSFDVPMFQKGVNKINYASSMQSHLIGVNWLYNDLHTLICGKNTMQNQVEGAVVAKHTEPFLFFTQAEGAQEAVFRGPCAYGAGKMDKPSWGYVKSKHAAFCMIEGADNDKPLTDMRVPFDDVEHGEQPAKVFYDPDQEAYYYRLPNDTPSDPKREKCIDFDGGKTDDYGYPDTVIQEMIKVTWNFLYLHAPRIRHYEGNLTQFYDDADWAMRTVTSETTPEDRAHIELAKSKVKTSNKYWCHTEGDTQTGDYILKRYDFYEERWVDAGLWDSENDMYEVIDLRTYSITQPVWSTLNEAQQEQSEIVNNLFIKAIVMDARENIGSYFKISSLKFHYAFQNHFIAGTDNCSKNTYYVLDPVTLLFELHQDDVDTVLATDNSGYQSKPYYIDRMHPFTGARASEAAMSMAEDLTPNNCQYEGFYNVLFDLCELMWEPNDIMGQDGVSDLASMLFEIFRRMSEMDGGLYSYYAGNNSGVWRALNKYLFNIQRYFPKTVYNEAARIRYELPELIGFTSDVRGVNPIKQSVGDQLQAELQFMKRRLVYMASYAAFGEFTATGLRNGLTGLSEAGVGFGMTPANPTSYVFKLVPHQWIYPTGSMQTHGLSNPHVRVAPNASNMPNGYFELNLTMTQASDQGVSVLGLNYYRELGNLGDMVANDGTKSFTINGRRLVKFVAAPTVTPAAFDVSSLVIGTATRLKEFNVNGASIGNGTLDVSKLTICEEIDVRGTGISQIRLPKTTTLTTLKLPAGMTTLTLDGLPSLTTMTMEGYNYLQSLYLNNAGSFSGSGSADLFREIYNTQRVLDTQTFTSLTAYGINWGGISSSHINWMLKLSTLELTGDITIQSGDTISFASVISLMDKFGDITRTENPNNPLFVSYAKSEIGNPSITGEKDVRHTGEWTGWGVKTEWGNNVGVRYYAEKGKYVPNITWSLSARDIDDSASSSSYAEMTDNSKGYLNVLQVQDAFEYVEWDTDKFVWRDVLHFEFVLTVNIVSVTNETYTVTKKVRFANRAPQVCDFAWHDGTFDNEADISKKLVGAVVMRELLFPEDAVEGVTPPNAVRAWVYAKENVNLSSNLAGDSSPISNMYQMAWGMYVSDSAGNNGFTAAFLNGDDVFGTIDGLSASYVTNTPIPNVTSTGSSSSYITDKPNNVDTDFIDRSEYDGFKKYTSDVLKDIDKSADYKSEIMQIATRIINLYIKGKQLTCTIDGQTVRVLADDEVVDTPTKLANAMRKMAIRASGYVKNYQFFFPATYACHVYRPSGMESVTLNAQYEQGKWMLPSEGLLGRIFNFYYNSVGNGRPRTTEGNTIDTSYSGGSGVNPNLEYIGDVKKEALMCLFSIIRKRLQGTGLSFSMPSASYYWSSSEYSTTGAWYLYFGSGYVGTNGKYHTGYIARGVAAFIFNL